MGHFEKSSDSPGGPVLLTGVTKVPGQAPPGWSGEDAGVVFPPPDRPYGLLEGWEFGPVFEPFTIEGEGRRTFATDERFPDRPFLLEAAHRGEGHFSVRPLTVDGKDIPEVYFNVLYRDFRGSWVPRIHPPQLTVSARDAWILRVKPVAAARRLTGTLTGVGHEALLYTGPAASLRVRFRGLEPGRNGHVSLRCYEVAGRTGLDPRESVLLLNDSGRARTTVRLPAGPLLVLFGAGGSWTLTVEE